MQKLSRHSTQSEAHIITQALIANGIQAEYLGSRSYASHYLGGDTGLYDVYVSEQDYEMAQKFLQSTKLSLAEAEHTSSKHSANYYFKKAVVHAFFAMFLIPFICNYISLLNLSFYLKAETQKAKKISYSALIILLQVPTFVLWYIFIFK